MIVFAAIVPHSPLLMPSIGKEHTERLQATLNAYTELEKQLYLAKVDTIVVISPHAPMYPDAFSGNLNDHFIGNLKEFGDHGTALEAKVDFLMLDHIHRHMREEQVPFTLSSSTELDYATTIPLLLLASRLKDWKLVPLSISGLPAEAHVAFGQELKRVIHAEPGRIALIASADLSHIATTDGKTPASQEGIVFDGQLRQAVMNRDTKGLLGLSTAKVSQCGLKPILTFMGCIEELNVAQRELSYEAPFGVGYFTCSFQPQ